MRPLSAVLIFAMFGYASLARADVYETTCHHVPQEATRANPDKAEQLYRFTIDNRSKVAFITVHDPHGSSLSSRNRNTRVEPLRLTGVDRYENTEIFSLHNDRTGFDYELTMNDQDYKFANPIGKVPRETVTVRSAGGIKVHDECNPPAAEQPLALSPPPLASQGDAGGAGMKVDSIPAMFHGTWKLQAGSLTPCSTKQPGDDDGQNTAVIDARSVHMSPDLGRFTSGSVSMSETPTGFAINSFTVKLNYGEDTPSIQTETWSVKEVNGQKVLTILRERNTTLDLLSKCSG